jgi:hypothetical protein
MVFRRLEPGPMALLGVRRNPHNGGVALLKLREFLLKCMKFRRTYESEVLGVEEQDNIFLSDKLIKRVVSDKLTAIDNGWGGEIRGGFSYEYGHNEVGVLVWRSIVQVKI